MKKALIHGERILQFGPEFPVAAPLVWVDVPDETTTQDSYVAGSVVPAPAPDLTAQIIAATRDHAEYLIRTGVVLEGAYFKGDGDSRARLAESIDGLTRGVITTAKFTTAAGMPFEVSDAAVLASLRDVFIGYGAAVLAASTDLQLTPPASPEDVPGNAAWPAVPNLTIAALTPGA